MGILPVVNVLELRVNMTSHVLKFKIINFLGICCYIVTNVKIKQFERIRCIISGTGG
jgi:hypothetical protein